MQANFRWIIFTTQTLVLLLASGVWAQQPLNSTEATEKWKVKWNVSDEFSDEQPNWKKWSKLGNLPQTNSWLWNNDANVTIQDGFARLTVRQNKNNQVVKGTYFQSGILKSYHPVSYGYFETRMRAAAFPGSGVCSSFWLLSDFDDSVAEGETIYSEIDVVELQQFDWHEGNQDDARDIDLNLHCVVKEDGKRVWRRPKDYADEQLNKWRAPWDPRDDFHVYGCEVNKDEIIWYVDGKEVARKPNTHWHRPKYIAVSLGLRSPFVFFDKNRNNASDPSKQDEARSKLPELPTSMVVDYIRVWERQE